MKQSNKLTTATMRLVFLLAPAIYALFVTTPAYAIKTPQMGFGSWSREPDQPSCPILFVPVQTTAVETAAQPSVPAETRASTPASSVAVSLPVVPAPESVRADIESFLGVLARSQNSDSAPTLTNDYLSYFAHKIEPYQKLLDQVQAANDWEQDAAEIRSLLTTQDAIIENLNPSLLQRMTKRRGLHRLNKREVEVFFSKATDEIQKRSFVLAKIDHQEIDFNRLSEILGALQASLEKLPDAVLRSEIQESMKPAIIAFLIRKTELLNSQRAVIEIKRPVLVQARMLYTEQTSSLENFIAIHRQEIRQRFAQIETANQRAAVDVQAEQLGTTYARLKKYAFPLIRKKPIKDKSPREIFAYYFDPTTGTFNWKEIYRLVGTKVEFFEFTQLHEPDDLFYRYDKLLPKLAYVVGEIIYRAKTGDLTAIIAIRPNGDVLYKLGLVQMISAEEMREIYYARNLSRVRYKIGKDYLLGVNNVVKIVALRQDGSAIVDGEDGRHVVEATDMRRARKVK